MSETVPGMAEAIEQRIGAERLTPTSFADLAGLTGPGLANVRKGKRRAYQPKTRYGVARALRWPIDWYERLLRGEDPSKFPTVEHEPTGSSPDERITALEAQIVDLREFVSALAAEVRQQGQPSQS